MAKSYFRLQHHRQNGGQKQEIFLGELKGVSGRRAAQISASCVDFYVDVSSMCVFQLDGSPVESVGLWPNRLHSIFLTDSVPPFAFLVQLFFSLHLFPIFFATEQITSNTFQSMPN